MRTRAAVARTVARVAEAVRAELPDAAVEPRDDGVAITGRRLRERLRWVGGLLR